MGLAGDEESVGHDVPRAREEAPRFGEPREARAILGADLDVASQDDGLSVEVEGPERWIAIEDSEDPIDHVDQPEAVGLEGLIPLPIPVRPADEKSRTHVLYAG